MAERRVALITGGGRGIGRACALRLARAGRDIVIADIGDFGAAVVPEVEALGASAEFRLLDVTDREAVDATVSDITRRYGRLDILVNCAGVLGKETPFLDAPIEEWHRVINTNLHGVYHCCRAVLPLMLGQGWGRIVTISSGARHGAATLAPYATSKGAVVSLMRSIANAYVKQGVLANCVEPGRALTDMVVPRFSKEFLANPPVAIGRYADPAEIAEVVGFLTSEECTYVAGHIYKAYGQSG